MSLVENVEVPAEEPAAAEEVVSTIAERPENIPADFWDADKGAVNTDKLLETYSKTDKIAKDLRAQISKGYQNPPETIEGYELQLDESLQAYVPSDDPLVAVAKEAAYEIGMSVGQFNNFIAPMIAKMADKGMFEAANAEPAIDQAAEIEKIGGKEALVELATYIDRAVKNSTIPAELAPRVQNWLQTADDVAAFKALTKDFSASLGNIPARAAPMMSSESKLEAAKAAQKQAIDNGTYSTDMAVRARISQMYSEALG
jgi:hypothetical protein